MTAYSGTLRMPDDTGLSLGVQIDLSASRLRVTAGDAPIGDWHLDDILVKAEDDGFHVRAEGEEVILRVDKDAEFAVDIGLRNAPPMLRRRMSAIMREHD